MSRTKPILLLIALFGLLPVVFLFLVFLPVRKRMETDQARLDAALQRNQSLPNIQPLTAQERALLENPAASWRTRIPIVATDAQRLAHYHRVITELQTSLQARNVRLLGVRSTWNPIKGSFTLPPTMGAKGAVARAETMSGAGRLQAWVFEAQVSGAPAELFKALETLPELNPLLEPVALRWDMESPQSKQMIVLRNLVTLP